MDNITPIDDKDYPLDLLPKEIRETILAIHDLRQVAVVIAGQSVLTALSFATQHITDVEVPRQGQKPLSCYFLSVAESGAGKTSAESLAMAAINARADVLEAAYGKEFRKYEIETDAYKQECKETRKDMKGQYTSAEINEAIQAINEPLPPLRPDMVTGMATYSGLINCLKDGQPSLCVSNDDSVAFIHDASNDPHMVALFTCLWSGTKYTRTIFGKWLILKGRRLTAHLMVQPQYAEPLLHGKYTADQGIVPRFNVAEAPYMEKATPKGDAKTHRETINKFNERIAALVQHPGAVENRNEVRVENPLIMSSDAEALFLRFMDDMTVQSRPGEKLAVIRTSAIRASETAARLAGIMTLFVGGPDKATIETPEVQAAIALMYYFLDQKLAIYRKSQVDPDMRLAEKVWHWMSHNWGEPKISQRDLCHYGIPA
ncbi:hypothetical protein H261_22453, partial [Paramagnetospirillum caucaseum]